MLSMYEVSVPVFTRALAVLASLLEKAEAHASETGADAEAYVGARLAEDMLPLSGQIQRASDSAKLAAARLTGVEAPKMEDNEASIAELKDRIARTIAFLEGVDPAAFDGSEERTVTFKAGPFEPSFTGKGYLLTFALPNFFFHVTTAYDILRNQGVPVGKRDYLGPFGS